MKLLAWCICWLSWAGLCGAAQTTKEAPVSSPGTRLESLGISGGGAMFAPAISPHDPQHLIVHCNMSCAFHSRDGGDTWEMYHHAQLTGTTWCRPVFHPRDPKLVYAASGYRGDPVISRDGGETWQRLPAALPTGVRAFAVDTHAPSHVLAGYSRGGHYSHDGGRTWSRCDGLAGTVVGFHLSPHAYYAGTSQGVFRSTDGGARWERLAAAPEGPVLAFAGGTGGKTSILYASVETRFAEGRLVGGIFRSTDGGARWESAMGDGLDASPEGGPPQYVFLLTTDGRPRTVYACIGREPGQPPKQGNPRTRSRVYRSDDAGDTWRPVLISRRIGGFNTEPDWQTEEFGGWSELICGANINPTDPDHVITVDYMRCFITRDGGKTWKSAHTRHAPGQGAPGKGHGWLNTGLVVTSVWHYDFDPFNPQRQFICYTDIEFARSEDGGKSWISQWDAPLMNTTYELAFDPEAPGRMWAAIGDVHDIPMGNIILGRHRSTGPGCVGRSDDGGVTWRRSSEGVPDSPAVSVVLDPKSPKDARTLYASVWEHGVYRSDDDGKTWTPKSQGLGAPGINMRSCRVILHPDGTLFCLVTAMRREGEFVTEGPGLYRSRDRAETWEKITTSQPLRWPMDFDVDPRDSRVIYLGAADADNDDGGLYQTTDGGATWKRVARQGNTCFGATVDPRRPDWVYLCVGEGAPGAGLWLSTDAGKTWAPFSDLPFRNAVRVAFDPRTDDTMHVCTFGGSVWKGPAAP